MVTLFLFKDAAVESSVFLAAREGGQPASHLLESA